MSIHNSISLVADSLGYTEPITVLTQLVSVPGFLVLG